MHKNIFTLPVSFKGSYTDDEPNFPRQKTLILQKKVSGVNKVVNFKDFSRNQVLFKDLNRIQVAFKTTSKIQDLFKIVQTMYVKWYIKG